LTHPLRVALILLEEARVADAASICAAVLHDAVEDSAGRVTRADIETQVGPEVAELVAVLTKPAGGNPDLKDYYAGLRRASPAARLIKLADRLDNVREAVLTADAPFHRKYTAETREVYLPLAEGTVLEGALREAYEDLAEVVGVGSMTARL
jgi:guanosine-3',5'-bis(diphosphate) 3'-pyrophosphohydrolase